MAAWKIKTYDDAARARLPVRQRSGRLDWAKAKLRALEADADPEIALPQRLGRGQAETVVKCPGCGIWTPPWALVDVRNFPSALTDGHAWACPGCWEGWLRNKKIAPRRWLELHGAPASVLARSQNG